MYDAPSVGTEIARNAPLTAGALYMNFIGQYGAMLVTTIAIVYGVMQMYLRIREHRIYVEKNKE